MTQSRCQFKRKIDSDYFTFYQRKILLAYGYQNEYKCPLSKDGKSEFCKYHNRETFEKKIGEEKELSYFELPQLENQKRDQDGKNL